MALAAAVNESMKPWRACFRVSSCLLLLCVLAASCAPNVKRRDELERNNPYLQKALAKQQEGNVDEAIEYCEKAIEKYARMAYAHLKLAEILETEEKRDYIGAIYHYRRYLHLRPNTEKREFIDERIRHAKMALVSTHPDQPPGDGDRLADLRKENALLRGELAELRQRRGYEPPRRPVEPPPVARAPAPAPTSTPAPPPAAAQSRRTYVVQKDDTLWSIARKVYGKPGRSTEIYEANRGVLKNPKDLQPGMTLVLPK